MPWTVAYSDSLQIVELTLTGRLDGPELQESAAARIALGEEHGVTMFLINARELIAPRSTTLSVYEIPANLYTETNQRRDTRIAVVNPTAPESEWIIQFYEDLCVNRGWRVRMHADRGSALTWLQQRDA